MNLLALLHHGEISVDEAYAIFDGLIAAIHRGESPPEWPVTLGLSNYEASAYLHGASLVDLMKVRYDGWPTSCARCLLPLDYRLYGWWFVHCEDEVPRLQHIECPRLP